LTLPHTKNKGGYENYFLFVVNASTLNDLSCIC